MKKIIQSSLITAAVLAVFSGTAIADAGISYNPKGENPQSVETQVNFKITIPKLMILRVGDWKGTVNTVEWNYAFGGLGDSELNGKLGESRASEDHWNLAHGKAAMKANADDAADGSNGILDVAAFGNTGDSLILFPTSTDFEAVVADTAQPHLSEISATGKTIPHPKLVNSGAGEKVKLEATKGIVSLKDQWEYTYTPGSTPVGGVYKASVVYTLATI